MPQLRLRDESGVCKSLLAVDYIDNRECVEGNAFLIVLWWTKMSKQQLRGQSISHLPRFQKDWLKIVKHAVRECGFVMFFYVYVVVNSSLKMLFSHIGCVNGDVYLCSGFWNEKNVGPVVWFQFEGMFGLPSGSHYCPALFYIYKCVHFREGFQNVKIFSTKMLWVWTKG